MSRASEPVPAAPKSTDNLEMTTMWTSIKAARALIAAASVLFVGLASTPSHAQVEYVRICTLYAPASSTCPAPIPA